MAKIIKMTYDAVFDDENGFIQLSPGEAEVFRSYLRIPKERLSRRIKHVRSDTTRYLMQLAIDNQEEEQCRYYIKSELKKIILEAIKETFKIETIVEDA